MFRILHPAYIRSDAALIEIVKRIEVMSELCLDCEFQTEGRFFPKLCLLQLAYGDELWAIDPHRVNLKLLVPILKSKTISKVLHDGRQDLPILARTVGIDKIEHVFDTQIAAAFIGYGGSVGYGAIVQDICSVKLDKSLQMSDWSRELSDAQLEYALDDVRYLSTVASHLRRRLSDRHRLDWALAACEEAAQRALRRPDPEKLYRRVASISRLNPGQLGILREIAKWRNHVAESIDKPVPSVANDLALKSMALHPPRDLRALESVRGLGVGRNQPWAQQLLDAIAFGASCPEENLRVVFSNEIESKLDGVVSLLRMARHFVAVRDGIAPDLLADSGDLRSLAETQVFAKPVDSNLSVLRSWRYEILGQLLLQVLSGAVAFRIDVSEPSGIIVSNA
jgi:ribonuclease D